MEDDVKGKKEETEYLPDVEARKQAKKKNCYLLSRRFSASYFSILLLSRARQ